VQIYNAGLKCAARGSLQIRDAKKSPKIANFVGLYLRNCGTYGQPEKNLLSSNIFPTCPHNMVNFGLLAAEIVSLVWGTPGNFNGFRVLAALLHCTLVVGVSQTAAFNRGRHLYSAGRPSRLALAHILVSVFFLTQWQVCGSGSCCDMAGVRVTSELHLLCIARCV